MTSDQIITDAERVAKILQGTCNHLGDALEEIDKPELDDDITFHQELDQRVFECEDCGWWFEISEMSANKDMVCDSCCSDDDE